VIGWDLITDLPKAGELDSVLTIVDQGCTKAAIFVPCTKDIDVEGVAALYAERVFPHYGIPVKVQQDLVLNVSKSGSIGATKQDLIKIKSRSSGESRSTSPH
jgi:hypothetical protein